MSCGGAQSSYLTGNHLRPMIPLRGGCKGNLEGCEKTDNTELGLWKAQDLCNCVKTETLDSLNRSNFQDLENWPGP